MHNLNAAMKELRLASRLPRTSIGRAVDGVKPPIHHAHLFGFEADFVSSLRCVPMAVRFKLDRVGVKLTLRQWSRFSAAERRELLNMRCEGTSEACAYRARLEDLIRCSAMEQVKMLPEPVQENWKDASVPAAVLQFAKSCDLPTLTESQWVALCDLQRFTLIKLSRDNHDNVNFVPALVEFGVLPRTVTSSRH